MVAVIAPDAPVSVTVVTPKRQTLTWAVVQPGSVQAFETTPVVAKLPGYVSKVHVDLGDPVNGPKLDAGGKVLEPGTLLAEVSIPELEQEARQKAALVEQAKAEAVQAARTADVAAEQVLSAEALLAEARAAVSRVTADTDRWSSELKRIEGLVGGRVVDSQTLDETRKQYRVAVATKEEVDARIVSAQAMVREAKAKTGRAAADVAAAAAKEKVAAAEAERTKALLGYTRITAPFKGVVTMRAVHTGHFLQSSGTRPEALFVIARLDTVRVCVEVPESAAAQAKAGTKAVVKFPALADREVPATITRTAGVLTPDSRTLRAEIELPNPDGAFKPGLYATVRIEASAVDALTVPAGGVLFADETAYCFVIQDGKATKLQVRTGRADGGVVELLGKKKAGSSGGDWVPFDGGEQVAVGNLGALADGQAVKVESK
jgi:RND family efflux transporter MFP subunit